MGTYQGLHTRNASSLREDTINRGDLATSQGGPTHSTGGGDHTPTHHLARTTTWGPQRRNRTPERVPPARRRASTSPPKLNGKLLPKLLFPAGGRPECKRKCT